jgi:ribosomal subunit interface protein
MLGRLAGKDAFHMGLPLRITYRDFERSDAIEASVRRHTEKLFTFAERIISCDVAIEAPHKHKQRGRHYRVRVSMNIPGAELIADRNPDAGHSHEDVYASIDDAFDRAARVLRDHVSRRTHRSSE